MYNTTLGIMSVATNIYIDYWADMVKSLDSNLEANQNCVAHVFTDQVNRAETVASELSRLIVKIHEIPAYRWPDATLRRYEIFLNFKEFLSQDILMHLDADMLILKPPFDAITQSVEKSDIALVLHPGYWNLKPSFISKVKSLFRGAATRGSWEVRLASTAYVPEVLRKRYVCGGVWIGKRDALLNVMEDLAESVQKDRSRGIEAVWHDESHLNRWAANNPFNGLNPDFCFVAEYPHLQKLNPLILAVTKKERTR